MAQYAVAARTALIVDMFLPALNLTGGRETLMATQPAQASPRLLLRQLAAALVYSSAFVVPLLVLAPATLALYGNLTIRSWRCMRFFSGCSGQMASVVRRCGTRWWSGMHGESASLSDPAPWRSC